MSNRITVKDLESMIERLNIALGKPTDAYVKDEYGRLVGNRGVLVLDAAYGGYNVSMMANEGGGEHGNVLGGGRGTKREVYDRLYAALCGSNMKADML